MSLTPAHSVSAILGDTPTPHSSVSGTKRKRVGSEDALSAIYPIPVFGVNLSHCSLLSRSWNAADFSQCPAFRCRIILVEQCVILRHQTLVGVCICSRGVLKCKSPTSPSPLRCSMTDIPYTATSPMILIDSSSSPSWLDALHVMTRSLIVVIVIHS